MDEYVRARSSGWNDEVLIHHCCTLLYTAVLLQYFTTHSTPMHVTTQWLFGSESFTAQILGESKTFNTVIIINSSKSPSKQVKPVKPVIPVKQIKSLRPVLWVSRKDR